jgi:hypothetical protein
MYLLYEFQVRKALISVIYLRPLCKVFKKQNAVLVAFHSCPKMRIPCALHALKVQFAGKIILMTMRLVMDAVVGTEKVS